MYLVKRVSVCIRADAFLLAFGEDQKGRRQKQIHRQDLMVKTNLKQKKIRQKIEKKYYHKKIDSKKWIES